MILPRGFLRIDVGFLIGSSSIYQVFFPQELNHKFEFRRPLSAKAISLIIEKEYYFLDSETHPHFEDLYYP